MRSNKFKKFAITRKLFLVSAIVLLFMVNSASASSVLGVGSHPFVKENIGNYENWPYEIRRQCVIEQSRVVDECSKAGYENWVVYQTVSGKGSVDGKNMTTFYDGVIVGNYDCEQSDLLVENGFLVDTNFHIKSRHFSAVIKPRNKSSTHFAELTCNFVCESWNCVDKKSLKEKIAEERLDIAKGQIFCIRSIFDEGITPQEREFLEQGWLEEEREELEKKQRDAEWEITRWWHDHYELLEKLCKSKGEDCVFRQVYNREIRLKELAEDEEFQGYYEERYAGEKLVEYCWYCSCFNFSFPKTTLRKNDLNRVKRLLERYEKYDLIQSRIDSLSQESYTAPSYLKGKQVNFIVYDGDRELTTIGVYFGEEVELGEGGFRNANIICETQFEEVSELKTLDDLVTLAEKKCKGADFLTDVMLKIGKLFEWFS